MNVGMKPSEAEELFELFDTDASGGPLGIGMASFRKDFRTCFSHNRYFDEWFAAVLSLMKLRGQKYTDVGE